MRIRELARSTGVDVETIRYYEKAGLLPAPLRQSNGYRNYGEQHGERLAVIRHCRALDDQLVRVRARLDVLHALENRVATRCAHSGTGDVAVDCGILRELIGSAHGDAHACQADESGEAR